MAVVKKTREASAKAAGRVEGQARVKAVLSGDTVVVFGNRTSPSELPQELTISLLGLEAPRLSGKRADEPFAFQSREFLRKLVIGKLVTFQVVTAVEQRSFGSILLEGEDVAPLLVKSGWVKVKPPKSGPVPPERQELMDLMEEARKEGLGIWNPKAADKDKVRTVHVLDKDARKFYDSHKRQKLKGIIEQVRDGSSLRVEALVQDEKSEGPQYVSMLVHIAGIACPRIPRPYSVLYEQYLKAKETDPSKEPPVEEKAVPYGAEAKFFTEIRLLHRDVEVELLAVDKQNNIFATVLVPEGNIAVSLLKNGFARIVEWSANATPYKALLEAAETEAKKRRVCLWHSYVEEEHVVAKKDFTGRVVQIISGDTVMVEDSSGYPVRISLASVRAPKIGIRGSKNEPFALEAKEFLRKSLIGHKVRVLVEYVRSSDSKDGDRVYGTIFYNKKNISVELVVSGLASVQSHRMDEDRSIHYDELLAAESKAEKTKKGKFSKSVPVPAAVIDLCERPKSVSREEGAEEGSASSKKSPLVNVKAKQYLPFLMKSKRLDAVVEYVFSGHRFKLYVPSENCVCFFSLAAVKSPASSGKTPEPYATEALNFAKSHILQHDVQIEVEGLDKGGNFLGHIFLNRRNFGIELLHAGLARLFPPAADRSEYRDVLYKAQDDAKSAKLNIWKDWVEPKEEEKKPVAEEEVEEKEVSTSAPKELKIRICDITDPTSFYFHFLGDRAELPAIQEKLAQVGSSSASAVLEPVRGTIYAGKYDDGTWHRVRIERLISHGQYEVTYIDFGNKDTFASTLKPLDPSIAKIPAAAKQGCLACAKTVKDYLEDAIEAFGSLVWDVDLTAKVEFFDRSSGVHHLTLREEGNERSLNEYLLSIGLIRLPSRAERSLVGLKQHLKQFEIAGKKKRSGMWVHGDFSSDEDENPLGASRRK